MQRLLWLKLLVLALLLLAPRQVPGAATQPQQLLTTSLQCSEPVLRQLDRELRQLTLTLQHASVAELTTQQLQQIEDLWQQLFALRHSPVLNKLYNQYQVQVQLVLQGKSELPPAAQAGQMTALRQRLLAAVTQTR